MTNRSGGGPRGAEGLSLPEDDSTLGQVVGTQLDEHLVAGGDADVVASHFPGDVSDDLVGSLAGLDFESKHGVRQRGLNGGFDLYDVAFWHQRPSNGYCEDPTGPSGGVQGIYHSAAERSTGLFPGDV